MGGPFLYVWILKPFQGVFQIIPTHTPILFLNFQFFPVFSDGYDPYTYPHAFVDRIVKPICKNGPALRLDLLICLCACSSLGGSLQLLLPTPGSLKQACN